MLSREWCLSFNWRAQSAFVIEADVGINFSDIGLLTRGAIVAGLTQITRDAIT